MNDNSCIIRGGAVVCGRSRAARSRRGDRRWAHRGHRAYRSVRIRRTAGFRRGALPVVDARGAFVTPGLVDIHSDYVETWRRRAERGHGPEHITVQGGPRAGDPRRNHHLPFAFRLRRTRFRPQAHPRLRQRERAHRPRGGPAGGRRARPSDPPPAAHARELDSVDLFDDIEAYLRSARWTWCRSWITRRAKDSIATCSCSADTLKGYRGRHRRRGARHCPSQQESEKLTYAQIAILASAARERGVSIASHDDDSEEKLAFMDGLEAVISEFPSRCPSRVRRGRAACTPWPARPTSCWGTAIRAI